MSDTRLDTERDHRVPQPRTIALLSERTLFRRTFGKLLRIVIESEIVLLEFESSGDLRQHPLPDTTAALFVDLAMLDTDDIGQRLDAILDLDASLPVIAVFDEQDDPRVQAAFDHAAASVLIKTTPPGVLAESVARVLEGQRCRPAPMRAVRPEDLNEALRQRLSTRQQRLLRLMLGGASVSHAARALEITPSKVIRLTREINDLIRGREPG